MNPRASKNSEANYRQLTPKKFGRLSHVVPAGTHVALCGFRPIVGETGWGPLNPHSTPCRHCKVRLAQALHPPPAPKKRTT